jgi:hypothetical protein
MAAATAQNFLTSIPISVQIVAGAILLVAVFAAYGTVSKERPLAGLPLISVDNLTPLESWRQKSSATLQKGLETCNGPFQVLASTGPRVILPHSYAAEIRNNPALTFAGAFRAEFFPDYPGFEGLAIFQGGSVHNLIQTTVRHKLTSSLALVTPDLVEEANYATSVIFGESTEWEPFMVRSTVLELVSRVVSRVLLGKVLCRDERWV